MSTVQRLKAVVSARGTVRVLERVNLPPGDCEVIVLPIGGEPEKGTQLRPLAPAIEGLIGLWADRDDITDSAEYAAELRRRLESGQDRRG